MLVDRVKWCLSLCILVLLFGCTETEPEQEEQDSNPETVTVGELVTLTAPDPTSMYDNINLDEVIYVWNILSKPTGSTINLTNSDTATPSFIPDFQGTYIFTISIFHQSQPLLEEEIELEALPQFPTTSKPAGHIASSDICDACHGSDEWVPASVDHNQVIGQCFNCHQQPAGHIPANNDCSSCHDSESWATERTRFISNRGLWETSNVSSFQFTYRCSCLPQGDLVITVIEGVVTEAIYADSGSIIPDIDLPDVMTIDKLFDVVDNALQSGSIMLVNYNIQYGYPQSVVIADSGNTSHSIIDFQIDIPPQVNPDQVELDENRLLWQQANIADYQYTYHISCFCLPQEDIVVVVSNGVITEAKFIPSGTPLTAAEIQSYNLRTIDQLFDAIQTEIDRPAAELSVTYNTTAGYPEMISVDQIAQAADDEYSISITDFQEIINHPANPLQTALDENRVLWQQANLTHYQYTYRLTCFCLPQEDIVVVVNGGSVVEAYFTPSGVALTPTEIQSNNLRTIDQLFDLIQAEIDRPAAQLTVSYNATSGNPEGISVDVFANVVDDEYSISVMDLQEIVAQPANPLQTALDENRALWQQANITDYQYTYRVSCFCPASEDIVVVVNAGAVVEAYFTPSGTQLTADQLQSRNLPTVDQLFDTIQTEIDRPAAQLTVTYDTTSGYPQLISVDPYAQVIDEEYHISVMDFQEVVRQPDNSLQTILDDNRALWQQANIYNYQYTYNISCFLCDVEEDIIVTVNSGIIIAAQFTPSGRLLSPQEIAARQLKTVEQMFNFIQTEIDRPAAELIVTYNAVTGNPETITVDPDAMLFDDQYTMTMLNLYELPRTPSQIAAQELLDENMALWQQKALTDYQFTYHRSCLCLPFQVNVIVRDGAITEAYFVDSGEALTAEQMANLRDIDTLFATIQNAIDRNVAELNVIYNTDFGYPETVYIDYFSMVVDDEISHVVTNFQIMNSP